MANLLKDYPQTYVTNMVYLECFWLLLKRFHGSGFHISDPDLIPEAVRIMQLIILCDKYSLHAFFLCKFQPVLQAKAKQVVLKASPSTDWSEMIVTEIRPLS